MNPKSGSAGTLESPDAPIDPADIAAPEAGGVTTAAANPSSRPSGSPTSTTVEGMPDPEPDEPPDEPEPEPEPTLTVRWSKERVTPDHNSGWPPASAPTDTVPEEAKVECLANTTEVPDGTAAWITIHHALSDVQIANFPDLEVQGGRVVDKATGNPPVFTFTAEHDPWTTWDVPFFYFWCTVDHAGLSAATPWQWLSQTAECLRVMYWHMNVADAIADTPAGGGLTTQAEMNEIRGIMNAQLHHKSGRKAFNERRTPTARWGSVLRNSYAYHHASHGDIVDRTTGRQLNAGNQNPPRVRVGNWRSVIILGSKAFGDAEVSAADAVPSTPKFLAYLDTCVAGWEPSFANAIIARGTQNVIAFRMYIPDGDARAMARRFHKKWIRTHNGDPMKINPVFFEIAASYYWSMRPVLFGYAGGAIVRGGRKPNVALGASLMEAEDLEI